LLPFCKAAIFTGKAAVKTLMLNLRRFIVLLFEALQAFPQAPPDIKTPFKI
jgi:hypothetical protein